MTDTISKERRSSNMSKIRSKDTSIELRVRKWLYSKDFRYRVNDKRYPGKPDITVSKLRIAIFIHGCFWHGHKVCKYSHESKTRSDYWQKKIEMNIERDKKSEGMLLEMGWEVIIIWECEVNESFDTKMNDLQKTLHRHIEHLPSDNLATKVTN